MPLFRRRNKAGTAEGPVVEANPNIVPPRKEELAATVSKPVDEKRTPTEPIDIVTEDREHFELPSLWKPPTE